MWDHLHILHVFAHSFLSYFTGGGDTICICPFSKMFKEYWGDMILYENDTYALSHHDCCDKVYKDPIHLYKHLAYSKKAHRMVVCYLRRVYGCRGKWERYLLKRTETWLAIVMLSIHLRFQGQTFTKLFSFSFFQSVYDQEI